MADHSRSTPKRGMQTYCQSCKSFVSACQHLNNHHPTKDQYNKEEVQKKAGHNLRTSRDGFPGELFKDRAFQVTGPKNTPVKDRFFERKQPPGCPVSRTTSPSRLSRTLSRRTGTMPSAVAADKNRRRSADSATMKNLLTRTASKKSSTPIMYSNSTGLIKPPPLVEKVECTLEDLCFGCIKKIEISRDAYTSKGQMIREHQVLTVKVKPGWAKGTKITFEGMGNEMLGSAPGDVVIEIAEKEHPMYSREGADLELAVEVPLVHALTGCNISIPLLGGGTTGMIINEVVYPGYQKLIAGQGMPKPKEQGARGNLKVIFLVEFPEGLTERQRYEIVTTLEDLEYSSS